MWAPLVVLQTSKWYSTFCHTQPENIRSDRCSSFPDLLFHVLDIVNMNIADDLLHIPPEIRIQGCQVQRVWGSLLPSAPPNPAPCKCFIKKFHNNVGIVCRSIFLLTSKCRNFFKTLLRGVLEVLSNPRSYLSTNFFGLQFNHQFLWTADKTVLYVFHRLVTNGWSSRTLFVQ
jgi:hypothetical protein